MAVSDAYVFPVFFTPVRTQLFCPKPPTFLAWFCRGERQRYAGKKVRLNRGSSSKPPGHESDTQKNFFGSIVDLSPPPSPDHVFQRIKISRTIFEKGHPRNNPVKLFQILINSFRGEEFWRISISPQSAKSLPPPHPMAAMFFDGYQNFTNSFWKWSHKEQSCKIIPNSDQRFQRRRILKNFYKSIECKKSFHLPMGAMFFDRSKFHKQYPRNNPVKLFQILISGFREEFWRISRSP